MTYTYKILANIIQRAFAVPFVTLFWDACNQGQKDAIMWFTYTHEYSCTTRASAPHANACV